MKRSMRICFVAFQFWPSVGGSQTQTEKQARYLRQLGQEVLVVTLRHQRKWRAREECATFPVVRIGGLYGRGGALRVGKFGHLFVDLSLFLALWRLRRRYDVIHTLQVSPLAAVSALVGKLTHKPVIIGVQSTGPCERDGSYTSQTLQATKMPGEEKRAIAVERCVRNEIGGDLAGLQQTAWGGQKMLDYLRNSNAYYQILSSRSYIYLMQHGFRPERIIYIPNGVDTQQFYPLVWAWPEEPAKHAERLILCVARLEYAKGIDVLLQAWGRMMAMSPSWREGLRPRLCLAGDGTRRAELEQLAADLGIQESVEFLGTRHDIPRLLREAWGFVLPSRWEGMPNALLEAMACALPCVATRVSGSEDVIEQGVNGLLVEPEQPEQLAYALRLLIEDTRLTRQLGWQGYQTVLRYYQLSSTVQSCLAFYRYLLSKGLSQRGSTGSLHSDCPSPEEWQRRYD